MSTYPANEAMNSGVYASFEVARFAFAPCASSVSTTLACPCSEAQYNAVVPSSVVGWFTSAPLP
eukprot:CAMPEP_0181366324 /NCGR_PEP_ID=MMETSP1106-20121128/10627_1 /TAXON_ID=81844 /ORGANISM="Mantoniella antarctica, Strain SL-175" /LENGTH=63 /DNA_ID=CAMNT_0023481633 /DNA_START=8 /DNA_END=196 /DNA_ORIENTATION=-